MVSTRNRVEGLRNMRYGEVLLVHQVGPRFRADVWNTMGFNDCPPDAFAELDPVAVAAEHGAIAALKNGPRHWVLDAIEAGIREHAPTAKFGTLEMFLAATIDFGTELPVPGAYLERRVARDTVFEWAAGAPLYELHSAGGHTYVMQALSLAVDPDQTIDALSDLEPRLELPAGWSFHLRHQPTPLRLRSDPEGVATVVQDEFANTYQRVDRID